MKFRQKQLLEELLFSEDFAKLKAKTNKFNIFYSLKLQNAEIRHSNFLGWLLTPFESHNLKDEFFKELLKIALKNNSNLTHIILKDLSDAEITLEKVTNNGRRIDIFIDCPVNKLVCIIENKIWSGEGHNQLEDYRNYILNHAKYKNYKYKIFMFLTPHKYPLCKDYKGYIRIDYSDILNAINELIQKNGYLLSEEVKIFIEHYKTMIERNIMGKTDDEIVNLCRKIYCQHKEAINLILENISYTRKNIDSALENIIQDNTQLQLEPSVNYWKRFTPKSVDFSKLNFANKTNDMDSNKIIVLEFNNYNKEQLSVDIIVRKTDDKEKLNKILQVAKEMFNYKGNSTNYYTHVLSKTLIYENEYYDFISNNDFISNLKYRIEESNIIKEFEEFANAISAKL